MFDFEYFDREVSRRNTNSMKWDEFPSLLPLWVADMDFQTAPSIIEALRRRVEHGIFGYTFVPEEYFQAASQWFEARHGWQFERGSVIYTSGVVPAISAIIKAMTRPGDGVIVQTPAYNCFFSSIRNNGCKLIENQLIDTGNGYVMDFDDLEEKAALKEVKILLLCNPHNPVGRVWTREELLRVDEICRKHDVFVISDEIHCELTYEGYRYTPFASLSEDTARRCAACVSPSKAFNIAGLQIANIVAADAETRRKIDRAINDNEVCDVNPFGVIATIEAYNHGADWLEGLRRYLHRNYLTVTDFFKTYFPELKVTPLEATYLAWINVKGSGMNGHDFCGITEQKAGVMLNEGSMYGKGGEDFVRLNFACPRPTLLEALERIRRGFQR